ncbi:MAG TPA: hypothetical protein VM735_06550 [Candidatus Kapabacteria bacterium]|nr:hypothetical protein [Candidatus Kapabacteria bacterium]
MNARFTIDGSEALENELSALCAEAGNRIAHVVPSSKIHALVLGGGYGRGEGGVLNTAEGDKPYNDLEFYIIHHGSDLLVERLYKSRVHEIAEELTHAAGIEVEFKLLARHKLERSPVTMFYYDLIAGHRLIFGTETWLAGCDQHRAAHRIPLYEATRLLMNRCSGLLFAQERLLREEFTDDDADFAGRNLAKAKLALGDVLLAMRGQYHWSCRERQKRLRKLDAEGALQNFGSVVPLHSQGVDFKLHPIRSVRSRQEFIAELDFIKDVAKQLWLTLEARRLAGEFATVEEYSFGTANKCPETDTSRNRLINARRFGFREALNPRYPRERLLNTLPLLLWETGTVKQERTLARIQEQLRTTARDYPALVRAYEAIWRIYN